MPKLTKHKILLLLIKYAPVVIAFLCFIAGCLQLTVLNWIGTYICVLLIILFLGIVTIFMSYVFDFCAWHRVTILYILIWAITQFTFWYYNEPVLLLLIFLSTYSFIYVIILILIYLNRK